MTTNQFIIAVLSSGTIGAILTGIVSVFRARSENRHQDANTMKVVQEVYGETIEDMREELNLLREEVHKLRAEVAHLERENARSERRIRQLTTLLVENRIPVPPEAA